MNTFRGDTVPDYVETLSDQFTEADLAMIDNIFSTTTSWQNVDNGYISSLQAYCQSILITMVNQDLLQPNNNLTTCMQYLITQLIADAQSVSACAIGNSVSALGTNHGNASWVISNKLLNGQTAQNTFNEAIQAVCVADSQTGGTALGQEQFQLQGQQAQSNFLNWNYPLGSGCNLIITACDPTQDAAGGLQNNLVNSDFEDWTASVPDNWTVLTGASQIAKSTSTVYAGTAALEFLGDGSTLTALYQVWDSSSGTTIVPQPNQLYGVNFWIKVSSAPAAGVLRVALVDGSNTVINDDQSNPNSFTVNLVTIGTSFVPVTGSFVLPHVLPAAVRIQLKLTTALSNTKNMFLDRMSVCQLTSLYPQGPYVGVVTGANEVILEDSWTLTMTNNYAGLFQRAFEELFSMRDNGFLLPYSGSPTISDGLIS